MAANNDLVDYYYSDATGTFVPLPHYAHTMRLMARLRIMPQSRVCLVLTERNLKMRCSTRR
jgi:hypothetical protein